MRLLILFIFLCAFGCATTKEIFKITSSTYQPNYPDDLLRRIKKEKPNNKPDHFAVILGLNTEQRHQGSISLSYQVLIERGYKRENIYILDPEGKTPIFPTTDTTSINSVEILFKHLSEIVGIDDTLLIYITGHGKRIDKKSHLVLNMSEILPAEDFIKILSKIHPSVGMIFADHCYWSSDFKPDDCNWVSIAVSTTETTSSGTSFPRLFWWSTRRGETILSAFNEAKREDISTKKKENRPSINFGACLLKDKLNILGEEQ